MKLGLALPTSGSGASGSAGEPVAQQCQDLRDAHAGGGVHVVSAMDSLADQDAVVLFAQLHLGEMALDEALGMQRRGRRAR
jgi:hypothetical protein